MTHKADLLAHYAKTEPRDFYQIDGFDQSDGGDSVMRPDADGDCLMSGDTSELMGSPFSVRVLVCRQQLDADAQSRERVARMLEKAANWVRDGGFVPSSSTSKRGPDSYLKEAMEIARAQDRNDSDNDADLVF